MPSIVVTRAIDRPASEVWERLADLQGHITWMRDAESIRFDGPIERGVGTRMVVRTRVGPFRTDDLLEVVGWEEGRSISVSHQGLVKGRGELRLDRSGDGSRVTWTEDLAFPWWFGGSITAWVAAPVLRRTWRRNLDLLAEGLGA